MHNCYFCKSELGQYQPMMASLLKRECKNINCIISESNCKYKEIFLKSEQVGQVFILQDESSDDCFSLKIMTDDSKIEIFKITNENLKHKSLLRLFMESNIKYVELDNFGLIPNTEKDLYDKCKQLYDNSEKIYFEV